MWQRKVEIPNIEFHELSYASVQTRRLSQSPIRYLISDGALDNLRVLRGRGSGGRNSSAVTLSAVEDDRTTSTGQVSLWDIPCKEQLDRDSALEPTEERSVSANTAPICTPSTAVEGTLQESLVHWLRLLLHRRYKIFPVRPKKWASDIFVNM
jgi:hypothetical protein